MKKIFYLVMYIVISVIVISIARLGGVLKLLELFWVGGTFLYMYTHRQTISTFFLSLPLPKVVIFILASLPFMLVEENINCLPSGCRLVPLTIPFLIIYLLIVRLSVLKFKLTRINMILLIFSSIGVAWEMFLGASSTEFLALPPLWITLIGAWTWLSYAYFIIIPIEILLSQNSSKTQ